MSSQPVKAAKRTSAVNNLANVHLTKLSPHMQKLIKKPLLKRSKDLYRPPGDAQLQQTFNNETPNNNIQSPVSGVVAIDEENAQAAADIQQHIRSLRPTLELVDTKQENSEQGGSKDRGGSGSGGGGQDDSRFSTTFGFSHGVDVTG